DHRSGSDVTQQGSIVGTPAYLAPELWSGEPATPRSDVYSLGATIYHLLAGKPPHDESTLSSLRVAVREGAATPLGALRPEAPEARAALVDRCLARDPAERFAGAEPLREALERLASAAVAWPASSAAPATPTENPYRGLQRFDRQHRGFFFGRDAEIGEV